MAGTASIEQICNKALGLLGQRPISDINDTGNAHAVLCNSVYYLTRDALLSEFAWGFATKRVQLEVDAVAPALGYSCRYALPADCLRVLNLDGGSYTWVIENGYLLTDQSEVYLRYLARVDESGFYDPLFVDALAARIARELAMPILKKPSAVKLAEGLYRALVADAKRIDATQDHSEATTESSWLDAR